MRFQKYFTLVKLSMKLITHNAHTGVIVIFRIRLIGLLWSCRRPNKKKKKNNKKSLRAKLLFKSLSLRGGIPALRLPVPVCRVVRNHAKPRGVKPNSYLHKCTSRGSAALFSALTVFLYCEKKTWGIRWLVCIRARHSK